MTILIEFYNSTVCYNFNDLSIASQGHKQVCEKLKIQNLSQTFLSIESEKRNKARKYQSLD